MTTFRPLHGRPSAYAKHMNLNWEVGRIALASAAALNVHQALRKSACFESRQGHHYRETWSGSSLSSREASRQTCHGRGVNLRPPAEQANALPKELSRQLISWLFGASTRPSSMTTFGPLHYCIKWTIRHLKVHIRYTLYHKPLLAFLFVYTSCFLFSARATVLPLNVCGMRQLTRTTYCPFRSLTPTIRQSACLPLLTIW